MSTDPCNSAQRLFGIAVKNAKNAIGAPVFDFQPQVIKKALVAAEILTLINGFDEDTADERVRYLAGAMEAILAHTEVF